jgi:RNA polymerase sigma-70 factor (ECF subfamily)
MSKAANVSKLFDHYRPKLARFISQIVKPQDIDDIVQETFVKSIEAELKHDIDYPRTFLLKTAKNLALNHVKRWDNKYKDSLEDFSESVVDLKSSTLEAEFESRERFLLFCRAVDQLPSQCRKTFVLKKVYGFSQKEVAAYLEISESTVEKHVAKGMLSCFEYIEDRQQSEPRANTETRNTKRKMSRVK